MRWIECECAFITVDRLIKLQSCLQTNALVEPYNRVSWVKMQCSVIANNGFVSSSEIVERVTLGKPRHGKACVDLKGSIETLDRLRKPGECVQTSAFVGPHFSKARVNRQGLIVTRERFFVPAEGTKADSLVVECLSVKRITVEFLFKALNGHFVLPKRREVTTIHFPREGTMARWNDDIGTSYTSQQRFQFVSQAAKRLKPSSRLGSRAPGYYPTQLALRS